MQFDEERRCRTCRGFVSDGSAMPDGECFKCSLPERLARLEAAELTNSEMIHHLAQRVDFLEEAVKVVDRRLDDFIVQFRDHLRPASKRIPHQGLNSDDGMIL